MGVVRIPTQEDHCRVGFEARKCSASVPAKGMYLKISTLFFNPRVTYVTFWPTLACTTPPVQSGGGFVGNWGMAEPK